VRQPSISALATAVYNGILSEQDFYARAQEIGYAPEDARLYLRPAVAGSAKPTRGLTEAQIVAAYHAGLFEYQVTLDRLEALGYSEDDAIVLIRTSKDLIQNSDAWYGLMSGSLDANSVISQLIAAHFSDADIYDAFASLPASFLAALGVDLEVLKGTLAILPGGA
jgi:hypothetical protein